MRILISVALCVGLLAPASFAQPADEPVPSQSVEQEAGPEPTTSPPELQLPESVTKALNDIATGRRPPLSVRLPENATTPLAEIAAALQHSERTKGEWWEEWAWLVGFAILAIAAIQLGYNNLNKSVVLERDEATMRSLQISIAGGDTADEKRLRNLIAIHAGEMNRPTKNPIIKARRSLHKWYHQQSWVQWFGKQKWFSGSVELVRMLCVQTPVRLLQPRYWLLGVGGAILLTLAIMPDGTVWPDNNPLPKFRFDVAKAAAWEILNTEFASAFAVSWIALLFFWVGQGRRLTEAKIKADVAVEEAVRALGLAHKEALREYLDIIRAIEAQGLERPRAPATKRQRTPDGIEEAEDESAGREEKELQDFRVVRKKAIELAIGMPMTGTEEVEAIESEIERLKDFAPPRFAIFSRDLADFVGSLRKLDRLPDDESKQEWLVVADGKPREALQAIGNLAVNLRAANVS